MVLHFCQEAHRKKKSRPPSSWETHSRGKSGKDLCMHIRVEEIEPSGEKLSLINMLSAGKQVFLNVCGKKLHSGYVVPSMFELWD